MRRVGKSVMAVALSFMLVGTGLWTEVLLAAENGKDIAREEVLEDTVAPESEDETKEIDSIEKAEGVGREESDDSEEPQPDFAAHGAISMSEADYNAKMNAFISDGRWCNGASWDNCAYYGNAFTSYMYGISNYRNGDWFTDINEIRTGDVIRVNADDMSGNGHTFVVLQRNGNNLYTAEGNYAYRASIRNPGYQISNGSIYNPQTRDYSSFFRGYHFVNVTYAPQNHQPRGAVDEVTAGTGTIRVRGWAIDDDSPSATLSIHVYIGDCAREGSTAEQYAITANKYRSDGGIGNHGFDETIDVGKVGNQRICIYFIDANVNDNPCKFDAYRTIGEGTPLTSGERSVPDGYYQIVSAINDEYELDVDGTDKFSDTPNIQLWKNRDEKQDVFYLTYDKGFYEIKHTLSGKCLDVPGASKANRVNVLACSDNDTVAQRWALKSDGRYWNIEAKCSGYRLDAYGGEVFDDKTTNVVVYRANDSNAQKWRLIPYAPKVDRSIEDGNYHIVSRMDGEKLGLNVSGTSGNFRNVTAAANLTDASQVFNVAYESSSGSYIIKQKGTDYYLEVESSGNKQNIGVATGYNGKPDGTWKKWVLKKDTSGYYGIVSLKTGEGIYYNSRNSGNVTCSLSNLTYIDQHFKFLRAVDAVSINQPAVTISKGNTRDLTVKVAPDSAANKKVTWSSSNPFVATVDNTGRVSAITEGKSVVTVKTEDGGYTATCTVMVENNASPSDPEDPTQPSDPTQPEYPTQPEDPLPAGQDAVLVVKQKMDITDLFGHSYLNYQVTPSGSASITNKGILTAKKAGEYTVTGLVKNGSKWVADDTNAITVVAEIPEFTESNQELTYAGATLEAVDNLNTALCEPTSWTTSNAKVASIDQNSGTVTALKSGNAKITAVFGEGKYAAKYSFMLKVVIPSLSRQKASMLTGASLQLKLNKTKEQPDWLSTDGTIAEVDDNGVVTACSAGNASVIATLDGIEYSCEITVKPPTLSMKKATLQIGNRKKISARNTKLKEIVWISSDESVAEVDENGVITGVSPGTAEISTTTGGCKDICIITVK